MSYQVLARKWRPRNFNHVVGQAHVLRVLVNALEQDRLHHAYLFTGTRGVGKTTIARILARCLNCERGITSEPCGKCSACLEIDEGRFVDLIEVDAASRTKVEDTRELLDNVQYAPTRGRFKVYLIDEIHMLSGHSFNALLKTLEEPPPHIKFLLATTDPQKLPVTILSRCLQFNLKRVPQKLIAEHLHFILKQEGVPSDEQALNELARCADGSLRDALSLLDQAVAYGNGEVRECHVNEMLDTVSTEQLHALVTGLIRGDAQTLMSASEKLVEQAADLSAVLEVLLGVLHKAALKQQWKDNLEIENVDSRLVAEVAEALTPEDIQLYYQIALTGRRDLPLAPAPKTGFEMVLLRMLTFVPLQKDNVDATRQQTHPIENSQINYSQNIQTPEVQNQEQVKGSGELKWPEIVKRLGLKGMAYALASNCSLRSNENGTIVLVISAQHTGIKTQKAEQRLKEALAKYASQEINLLIEIAEHESETPAQMVEGRQKARQEEAEHVINDDVFVNGMKEKFGAQVVPGSIKPLG